MTVVSALQQGAIIQPVEQHAQNLHQQVSNHLNQAGFGVTPSSINPQDQSPLKEIKEAVGDTTHVVGTSFEELVGGTSDATSIRTTEGKAPILISAARELKRRFLKKAA